jgi:hypothetical protein
MTQIRTWFILFVATAMLAFMPTHSQALEIPPDDGGGGTGSGSGGGSGDPFDCSVLVDVKPSDAYEINPDDVLNCVHRGWDPPKGWLANEGVNKGVRVGGATGFSYGAPHAPEASPGKVGAKASVTKQTMNSSCSFPPKVKVGWPLKLKFPAGSCWDVMAKVIKDVNGKTRTDADPAPPSISPHDRCPAESDTTGLYGIKKPIVSGSANLDCGGMVPITTVEMTLNMNPTYFLVTEEGRFHVKVYAKRGTEFKKVLEKNLPQYLCQEQMGENQVYRDKDVDLTPPVAQTITFDGNTQEIALRLQSRSNIPDGFQPPYNEEDPIMSLVFPFDSATGIAVPTQEECPLSMDHYKLNQSRADVYIKPSYSGGCEGVSVTPTSKNEPIIECPPGAALGTDNKCRDDSGAIVQGTQKDNWVKKCPSGITPVEDGKGGHKCPEDENIPSEARCAGGEGDTLLATCDVVSNMIKTEGCTDKLQYAVLDRPNIYYPPGSSASFIPVEGRTALMAETKAGTQLYMQSQTIVMLQSTAPPIRFNDGGFIVFPNEAQLIMKAPAIVEMSAGRALLINGGEVVNGAGEQLQSIKAGQYYPLAGLIERETEVRTGRSITLPEGFLIPTKPTVGANVPYIRLPMTPPPR